MMDLLTEQETARKLRRSTRTLRRWRELGCGPKCFQLPSGRRGKSANRWHYLRKDVNDFILMRRSSEVA